MKKLILIALMLFIAGCGITGEAGDDGANGLSGTDGRSYETPVIRPYTWDTTYTVVNFSDVTGSNIKLSQIAMNLTNNNNYLFIAIPANNAGKEIQCIINGTTSVKITVPDNSSYNLVFSTLVGIDNAWTKYMNCEKLDMNNDSYFAWYVDGILQEYYFCDSFQ